MPFVIVRPIELQRLDGLGAAIRIKPTTGQQRASSDSGDAIFDAPSRTYKCSKCQLVESVIVKRR